MSLRKLLENPSGGQLLSAAMLIVLLVLAEALFAFGIYRSVMYGTAFPLIDPILMVAIGTQIASAVSYIRKRHGTA